VTDVLLKALAQWRELATTVARAVKEVRPDAEVYVVGGAAESRLTVLSDIDIAVVLPEEPSREEAVGIIEEIFQRAEELGLPLYAPVEIHVVGPQGFQKLTRRGKAVKLSG
jgi:predicted nucleotidyltransferase